MIINSLLDQDLYKMSMSAAIRHLYPDAEAEFQFINRRPSDVFDEDFKRRLDYQIQEMGNLRLAGDELEFLKSKVPYLGRSFMEFIKDYRFNPDEVKTAISAEGQLSVTIKGLWHRVTFYEVPLMATISELYFGNWRGNNQKWNYDGLAADTHAKAELLSGAGCNWADFGTRRRRSFKTQDEVVAIMRQYPGFVGTSNVALAMKYGVKPIGTYAHEAVQAHSVLSSMRHANRATMEAWASFYHGNLGIALSDTYGTDAFLGDFDLYFAKLYDGVRQDSGDAFLFAEKMVAHYRKLGIDSSSKTIVFSDSLNAEKCVELKKYCDGLRIKCSFGIGTALSNSFPESSLKALNIVVKMVKLNGIPVVKLSDDPNKAVGDKDALRVARWVYFGTPLDGKMA